jgi:predicted nuclease of predicted toxin-antitoxin system
MQAATDHIVLEHAKADERILVSADTDFGGCSLGPVLARHQ